MSISNAEKSISIPLPPPPRSAIKEIRIEIDGIDPKALEGAAAAANASSVEDYLQSIVKKMLAHPCMAEILKLAASFDQK